MSDGPQIAKATAKPKPGGAEYSDRLVHTMQQTIEVRSEYEQ
jgi:hypothetical protein